MEVHVDQEVNASAPQETVMMSSVNSASGPTSSWTSTFVYQAVRLCVGGVLVYSALIHLGNQFFFLASLVEYRMLGQWSATLAAVVLPWIQLVVGLCLLGKLFLGPALVGASCLFALFSIAQGFVLLSGWSVSCGCFGVVHQRVVSPATFFLTSLTCAMCVASLVHARRKQDA